MNGVELQKKRSPETLPQMLPHGGDAADDARAARADAPERVNVAAGVFDPCVRECAFADDGDDGKCWSGAAFQALVATCAERFLAHATGREGEHVVIASVMRPSAIGFACWLATNAIGAVAAPLSSRWGAKETVDAARRVGAVLVVCDEDGIESARDAVGLGIRVIRAEELIASTEGMDVDEEAFARLAQTVEGTIRRVGGEDVCLYCHTSGTTTGVAKAAMLTHAGICAASAAKLQCVGYDTNDIFLHFAPMFHIGGMSSAHAAFVAGANHIFMKEFDAERVLEVISRERVTAFIAVPTMITMLLRAVPRASSSSYPSVKKILIGGGRLVDSLSNVREIFPSAVVTMAYGMSETSSSVTFMRADDARLVEDATFAGEPAPGVEIKTDASGQLLVRGPQVMRGYVGIDRASTFDVDGWFPTGDLGKVIIDASGARRCWLVGRLKEMIKSGGENVAPQEVESVLCAHDNVAHAVVIGVPHALWGEAVAAVVRLKAPRDDAIRALKAHCAASLARFKVPKTFVFITDDIPKNASGKVSRARVRETYMDAILRQVVDDDAS